MISKPKQNNFKGPLGFKGHLKKFLIPGATFRDDIAHNGAFIYIIELGLAL
jgi:hypothetical protein